MLIIASKNCKKIHAKMSDKIKRYCIMPSCKGEKMDLVHKFPRNDARAREWLRIINLPELDDIPLDQLRKSKFICTRHFALDAYKHAESRSLNITAVPSQNLNELETLDHIVHRERKPRGFTQENVSIDLEPVMEEKVEEEIIIAPQKRLRLELDKFLKLTPVNVKKKPHVPEVISIKIDPEPPLSQEITENVTTIEEEGEAEILEELPEIVQETPQIDFLEIQDEEKYPEGIRLNYFWLRDHCRCEECYDRTTSQRKFDITDLSLDIRPLDYEIVEDELRVKWPDNHKSSYNLDFLYNSQFPVRIKTSPKTYKILWDTEKIQTCDYARVPLSDLLCNDDTVKLVLTSLVKYGVAFIEKVPATQHSTEMTITRLFPLMKTFFGEMWTFSDTKDHHDFAYTNNFLHAHNDNTYFNDAAGLQILHCIQHQGDGGENFLIDGFHIIQELEKSHSQTVSRLKKYHLPSEYVEEGRVHRHIAPIIKENPLTGEIEQIRFNLNDRATLNTLPFDQIQDFYTDFHLLAKEIQKNENEWSFKLNPGTVLIFDNWRVLHGRKKYTGKRVMTGAYVQRTEFLSAARVAGVID